MRGFGWIMLPIASALAGAATPAAATVTLVTDQAAFLAAHPEVAAQSFTGAGDANGALTLRPGATGMPVTLTGQCDRGAACLSNAFGHLFTIDDDIARHCANAIPADPTPQLSTCMYDHDVGGADWPDDGSGVPFSYLLHVETGGSDVGLLLYGNGATIDYSVDDLTGSVSFPGWNGTTTFLGFAGDGPISATIQSNRPIEILSLSAPDGVPEPATWLAMVSGFALMGGALRASRRRNRRMRAAG